MLRRILFAIVASMLLFALAGCGDDGGGSDSSGGEATESGEPAAAPAEDAQSVEAQLQERYGDTEWFAGIDHIASVMKLRHPVWEVHFAATVGEVRAGWLDEVMWAFSELGLDDYYLDVYATDGLAGSTGSRSGESVTLPAAPGDVSGMAAWMDAAYGPGSGDAVEDWYAHITGFDFETDAWDGDAVLVVKTDLTDVGSDWSPERETVSMIKYAVSSSGLTWATNLRIEDAAQQNLNTGELRADMVPYVGY